MCEYCSPNSGVCAVCGSDCHPLRHPPMWARLTAFALAVVAVVLTLAAVFWKGPVH